MSHETTPKLPDFCLRLPACLASLSPMREMALKAAERAGLDEQSVQRLDLVLEEALMNVIHHAYPSGGGDMELSCRAGESGRICLALRDWGSPFDPLSAPDDDLEAQLEANLDADLDSRAAGGLGLFLIRSMSEASYRRENEANVLSFCVGP